MASHSPSPAVDTEYASFLSLLSPTEPGSNEDKSNSDGLSRSIHSRPVYRRPVESLRDLEVQQSQSVRPRSKAAGMTRSISSNSLLMPSSLSHGSNGASSSGAGGIRRSLSSLSLQQQRPMPSSSSPSRNDIESELLCIPEQEQVTEEGSLISSRRNKPRYQSSVPVLGPPDNDFHEVASERKGGPSPSNRRASLTSSLQPSSVRNVTRSREDGLAFNKGLMPNLRRGFSSHLSRTSLDISDLDESLKDHDLGLQISHHASPVILDDIESGIVLPQSAQQSSSRVLQISNHLHEEDDDANSVASKASSINSLRSTVSKGGVIRKRISFNNLRNRAKRKSGKDSSADDRSQQSRHSSRRSTVESNDPNYSFLAKENKYSKVSLQAGLYWWRSVFVISFLCLVACMITLWAPYPIGARQPSDQIALSPWSDGCQGVQSCICPRETICADDLLSMILLTLSRASAWFDYPLYMLMFLSKARNLNNFLQNTMLKCWVNFSDLHKVHSMFGCIVGIESLSHSFFHLLRWMRREDDIRLLWTHQTGITGLISLLMIPLIVLPMTLPFLKKKMTFELRKSLHYLSIVWGACLMYHAPQQIYWLIGVPLVTYAADFIFGVFHNTHLVENAYFERLGDTSCVITFENPRGFGNQNSAYVYLMLPWLSKYQFHVFSIYPCNKVGQSQICISKSGGWTSDLMASITTPTHKPAFVVGPYLSPFCSPAMDCENLIAIASGIGVTPILSLIKK